ncbi:MAG: hypothetical protein R3F61_16505 [Myxococcota bacterium]
MLTTIVMFSFTLIATVAVGIPLAARMAQAHVWKRTALPEMPSDRDQYERMRFEPVDFGPDLIQWPSEIERESFAVAEPPWPSASWNDEHFGRYSGSAMSPQSTDEAKPRRTQNEAQKALKPKERRRQAPPKEQQRPAQQQQRAEAPRPEPQARPEPQRPATRPPPAPAGRGQLPDSAEVERMVAEMGLAGTVQHLMKTQGWDFKTAAGWLGRARKG